MQIVALQQRHKAPTIEKLLHEEGLHTTRQGIHYLLKKYQETGLISRKEGAGRKTKIN